jgi:hypothetical protein
MMNSISRPIAFMFAVATIAAANSAGAQQAAAEGVALAACNKRAATAPSPQLAVDGNKHSAHRADANFDKPPVLALSTEGLVRRTSLSALSEAQTLAQTDSVEHEEELGSRPQACYPPAAARKMLDR